MTYESLLLNCGGGIISDTLKSAQYDGAAALCIGIGGTGIAALSDLKGKIYQQLIPDNPGEPIPRYDAIQLLGIDADDTDYKRYHGNCRLSEDEFVSIKKDNLGALLGDAKGKNLIRTDPRLNWMEIDRITTLLSPAGAGGIRQMGRYMLLERASQVAKAIERKAALALEKRGSTELDVYIFAGISGGTGSGCFLDTCYLARKVIQIQGWNAKLMGFFFLPDVVTSKKEVAAIDGAVAYNNSNGYAAMKELDYLMDLPGANDWFEQNYGADYQVRTQEPPVEMCHLISAQQADGKLVPNGFGYGINVASDYAMSYLADVDTSGNDNDESGLTMRGHLANVVRGVQAIPRRFGANLSYHVLGASNAEIPMNQINTYLAVGFFKKFRGAAYKEKKVITMDIVQRFMEDNRFTVRDVHNDVIRNSPTLELVNIDRRVLASEPCCAKNELPRTWADAGNDWHTECEGMRTRNALALNRELESYSLLDVNDQSLIGRLFRKLWELTVDPAYGPYYAAALLDNNGQDLQAALAGAIAEANEKADVQAFHIPHREEYKVVCNQELIDKRGSRRSYADFKGSAEDLLITINTRNECSATARVLGEFLIQVKALSESFFRPLVAMLENLKETFEANATYLQTPEAKAPNAYTWQILNLDDVKGRLDDAIKALDPQIMVRAFSTYLLENSGSWVNNKSEQVAKMIRDYILKLFSEQTNRSLESYLYELYDAKNVSDLMEGVKEKILKKVDRSAVPMFWCDPTYDITNPTVTFSCNRLSVPKASSAICSAADEFKKNIKSNYGVRKTGLSDRIFALRFISGIPLFAYHGITLLKDAYDAAANTSSGVGSHLYAYTGRGKDGSGYKDWRNFLPTPMPYSKVKNVEGNNMVPEGAALVKLYEEAENRQVVDVMPGADGVVSDTANATEYAIFVTPERVRKDYTLNDFLDEQGKFNQPTYDKILRDLDTASKNLHNLAGNPSCKTISLKNDGDAKICEDVRDVRMDYFIHYPMLQKAVRDEIRKDQDLKDEIQQIQTIRADYEAYTKDLENFSRLLFYRMIDCTDESGNTDFDKIGFVSCELEDRYGDRSSYYLCDRSMPFSRYPLYQAFRSYRFLADPSQENTENLNLDHFERSDLKKMRKSLDEKQADYHNGRRVADDYLVPAVLEQVWSSDALRELRYVTLRNEQEAVQQDVYRFYNELRNIVNDVKRRTNDWPRNKRLGELMAMLRGENVEGDPPKPPVTFAWVYDGSRMLEVHLTLSRNQAFHRDTNSWVPLHSGMLINVNNAWVPIQLDAGNNVIL